MVACEVLCDMRNTYNHWVYESTMNMLFKKGLQSTWGLLQDSPGNSHWCSRGTCWGTLWSTGNVSHSLQILYTSVKVWPPYKLASKLFSFHCAQNTSLLTCSTQPSSVDSSFLLMKKQAKLPWHKLYLVYLTVGACCPCNLHLVLLLVNALLASSGLKLKSRQFLCSWSQAKDSSKVHQHYFALLTRQCVSYADNIIAHHLIYAVASVIGGDDQ